MLASLFALLPLLALASASPIAKREAARLIRTPGGQCLSVSGGARAVDDGRIQNGTPIVAIECGQASKWDIAKGSGSVIVSGTNYALDIGLEPTNNGGLKIWDSYPTAPQQTWYLTDDNRIAQTGGNQCLDLGPDGPQTYECTTGNTNQVWEVRFMEPGTTAPEQPSTPAPANPSGADPLPSVPRYPVINDTPGEGKRIHPVGRDDMCVTVAGGTASTNSRVGIAECFNDYRDKLQTWDLPAASSNGLVRLHNYPNMCLDAGSNPASGVEAKLYPCGDGWAQQNWEFSGNTLKTANNQCLDIVRDSGSSYEKPYITVKSVQTWECSTNGNPLQAFSVQA